MYHRTLTLFVDHGRQQGLGVGSLRRKSKDDELQAPSPEDMEHYEER